MRSGKKISMNIFDIILILLALSLSIWAFVVRKLRSNNQNARWLSLFSFFSGVWMTSVALTNYALTEQSVMLLTKFDCIFALLALLFFKLFVSSFVGQGKVFKKNLLLITVLFFYITSLLIAPNNIAFSSIKINPDSPPTSELNILFTLLLMSIILYILVGSIFILLKKYSQKDRRKKIQTLYIIVGFSINC